MPISDFYEVMGKHLKLVPTNLEGVKAIEPPPAGFDPRHADTPTLLRYGINPRPDPKKMPEAAAMWDKLTARSYEYLVPTLTPRPEKRVRTKAPRRPQDTGATLYSQNWSGGVIFNPDTSGNDPYQQVQGQWVVPAVEPPTSGDGFWASLTWVGVDGDGSSDVMQIGTGQYVSRSNGVVTTEYFAFIEWFTYTTQQVSIAVNPGDTIFATISNYGLQNGVYQAGGRITNVTQGTTTAPVVSAPPGTLFQGNVAEWIMERPSFTNAAGIPVPATIAEFAQVSIYNTSVCSRGGNYYGVQQPMTMTADGTPTGTLYVTGSEQPTIATASWAASS